MYSRCGVLAHNFHYFGSHVLTKFYLAPLALPLSVMLSPGVARAANYTVTDIGSLGGRSYGYGINNSGQVVGFSSKTPLGNDSPFLFSAGVISEIKVAATGGNLGGANAINDSGQIVGATAPSGFGSNPFIYQGASVTIINVSGEANAISPNGTVAGEMSNGHGFLYQNNSVVDIGQFTPNRNTYVNGVNDLGHAVGYGYLAASNNYHAFVYADGGMSDLGTLGGPTSQAMAINQLGQIVGVAQTTSSANHAFSYEQAVMTDLGEGTATAINSLGEIVGYQGPITPARNACLFTPNGPVDLNALISPDSGWNLLQAYAVNDVGQIAGWGTINGQTHAFLLTPAALPEPSSSAIVFAGLVQLLRRKRVN